MGREFESLQARYPTNASKAVRPAYGMVGIVQSVERQIVVLDVTGSSPVTHPTFLHWAVAKSVRHKILILAFRRFEPCQPSSLLGSQLKLNMGH